MSVRTLLLLSLMFLIAWLLTGLESLGSR